ncbi:alpha/beta fold hydrolase [Desmospora activa]|uniref:Pimeloyl-ACP methyl ester carboxylesterase n=1 Tax=Desmospora activa DSM 45169 TaxID=1121389 RepID=A0A2T4Z8K2_9BACL|nr:alpha/beta hydrolase [Desmospora activa]PTM58180.1 pimeloyl-ACP methyl ester carboxylesterase [Desmospora activa DSM 45169]
MGILYGLETPLMVLYLFIWIMLGWLSGHLGFVSGWDQVKKNIRMINVYTYLVGLLTVLIVIEGALGFGYLFEKDKQWFNFILLILPLASVCFLSLPKTKRILEAVDTTNDEMNTEIRRLTTARSFVLPYQLGVYATTINLCFFLFPYGSITITDYLIPCALLLVLLIALWFRYSRRQRIMSKQDFSVQGNWINRIIRISVSLALFSGSIAAFLTLAVVTTISNGESEENRIDHVEVKSGYVETEGDNLYYEVRGEGPPLLMIPGGGGDAGFYTYVADILADEYQVITYDRRGNSRSTRHDPQNFEVSQQARDAVAVLRATNHDSAYVFGNSGGAIFALEMAEKFPETIQAVVVHEPPTVKVLPDRDKWLTLFSDIYQTANRLGVEWANLQFAFSVGVPASAFTHIPQDFQERNAENTETLIQNEMLPAINYEPNIEKLKRNGVKVIMAAGELSLEKERFYAQTALILAKQLDAEFVIFPGHHLSYFDSPAEWAETLRQAFQD